MKLAMMLNQIQAGVGTKDDVLVPLTATKDTIGPGVTLKPLLSNAEQNLLVTFYIGDKTYTDNKAEVQRKIKGMLARLDLDGLICGPSFNYPDFSTMAAEIAKDVQDNTSVKVVCAMSEENAALIAQYKDELDIVKMPKKGGVGLNDAYKSICKVLQAKENDKKRSTYQDKIY